MVAVDLEANRMSRVEENLERLKLSAELKVADVGDLPSWWDEKQFDRILLDAPCSATGVIRRHPDIKLLRRAEDVVNLAKLQLSLLTTLWQTLKPGRLLVYATCSGFQEENEKNVEAFVQSTATAEHQKIEAAWGIERPYGRQLFPSKGAHDGFFYAKIRKLD
jgi:16S rRNA (cytosine967-C5)-methyltransferase